MSEQDSSAKADLELDLTIALHSLSEAVILEDPNRVAIFANDAFGRMFLAGAPGQSLIGADCGLRAPVAATFFVESSTWLETTERITRERRPVLGERWQLVSGEWLERAYLPRFSAGRFLGHTWVYRDVTECEGLRMQASALVHELASTPSLTTAFQHDRAALDEVLDAALDNALEREAMNVTLALVKVENLALINLEAGRAVGDDALTAIPQRIAATIPGAWIGRISGATFAIVPPAGIEPETVLRQLRESMGSISEAGGQPVLLRCSIGVARGSGSDVRRLRTQARVALGEAQRNGHARVFDEALAEQRRRTNQLGLALPRAIREGELSLVYQPVVTLDERVIRGHESLLRWDRPGFGTLSAASFVPLAERLGLASELDTWTLDAATRACRRALQQFGGEAIGINISGRTLNERDGLARIVAGAIEKSGMPPNAFVIEVTETAAAAHTSRGIAALHELVELGVQIAIDDFGVGSSSLALIGQLPFDFLKLDKSFTRSIADSRIRGLVSRTVSIASDFGATVTAEGIECQAEFDALQECGVFAGQGWFLGVPAPLSDD